MSCCYVCYYCCMLLLHLYTISSTKNTRLFLININNTIAILQISSFGGIYFLTYLRKAWTYINENYHNYSLPDLHDTDDILKVIVFKGQGQRQFFRRRHRPTDRRFAAEDHLVYCCCINLCLYNIINEQYQKCVCFLSTT